MRRRVKVLVVSVCLCVSVISLGSRPSPLRVSPFFLIASVNCAAVRGRETLWKAWDDTSRGDRQEIARRRVTAFPIAGVCGSRRES